jgi:hypothetical protein
MNLQLIAIIISVSIPLLGGIIFLIKVQMKINSKLFLEIANLKKDVSENIDDIKNINFYFDKKWMEMSGRNQKEHNYIIEKIDNLYNFFIDRTKTF